MRKFILLATLSLLAAPASAADHLFTAVVAGGLSTTSSQPFLNGTSTTNNSPTADAVPGQGSPLSGNQYTVPATDTQTGATLKTMPTAVLGKTAPSGNSVH